MALRKFQQLKATIPLPLGESDTRAKIIDPLFKDCLGWAEEDIRRETHVNKGFLDYTFSVNNSKKFVLEAKAEGNSFTVPEAYSSKRYRIAGTISTDRKIKEAIDQAQRYCVECGARYGVVSNGHQYIIFEAFGSDLEWRKGRCMVFRSLQDVEENFGLFWNVLNKESVANGSLRRYVSEKESPVTFVVPKESIHPKDTPLTRNDLNPILDPFMNHIFGDMTDVSQLNVLMSCYVRRKEYESMNRQIGGFFDRPPKFSEKYNVAVLIESETDAGDFQRIYEKCQSFLRTQAPQGSLLLLMGGIGSGKTTFLHHFFSFVITRKEKTIWFYVDFSKTAPKLDEIESYIYGSILQDFEKRYGQQHNKLKEDLRKIGIDSIQPNAKDMCVLFSKLTQEGYTLSLVLDNVDQHYYVEPKYQEQVLLVARNLTETLRSITILTLREESFFRSTMSGALDAFIAPVIHTASPHFGELVRRRIDFVMDLLKKSDEEIEHETRSRIDFRPHKDTLSRFFEIIGRSLKSSSPYGEEILRFMDQMSGGDMRTALHFFRTFLVSGNTDVNDMLARDARDRANGLQGYFVPFHHVVKSVILEHSRLYSSPPSRIMNVFHVNPHYTNSHFLHLRLLDYLNDRASFDTVYGEGFVEINDIVAAAEEVSINRRAISDSLKKLAFFGLVQFENQMKDGYDKASHVRITRSGSYYLKELAHKFQYVDLVWMDTPISDPNLVREQKKHFVETRGYKTSQQLDERFLRTKLFLDYLAKREEKEFKENPEFLDSTFARKKFMPDISKSFEKQKDFIIATRRHRSTVRK